MPRRKTLLALAAILCASVIPAIAQDDAPSLGDVARQARQQKQSKVADTTSIDRQNSVPQNKDALSKSTASASVPAAKKVITNDEIPSHVGPTATYRSNSQLPTTRSWSRANYNQQESGVKLPAQQWSNAIQSQKTAIANMQAAIDQISASIQYTGANCISRCVEWNEQQKRKQDEVDAMKAQLEQGRQRLEQMQEQARRQGYGSSVYDP